MVEILVAVGERTGTIDPTCVGKEMQRKCSGETLWYL